MWYAINVKAGKEDQALDLLQETALSAGLEELFVPGAEMRAERDGEQVRTVEPLFPGCVVAVAPGRREVRAALRRARGIDELMGEGRSAEALGDDELAFIDAFTTPGDRVVPFSEGVVDRGRVVVESGPLLGREAMIDRVSHRKRRAYLHTSVAGRDTVAEMGLRLKKKQPNA